MLMTTQSEFVQKLVDEEQLLVLGVKNLLPDCKHFPRRSYNANQTLAGGINVTVLTMDLPLLVSIPTVRLVSLFNVFSRNMSTRKVRKKDYIGQLLVSFKC